jgi:hypothetical protein
VATKNLWGEIPTGDDIRLPIVVLREQAAMLAKATRGVLEGFVAQSREDNNFELELRIVAPALDHYQYTILRVLHGISIYPLRLAPPDTLYRDWITCSSEEEFEQALADQLSSKSVKKVIASLLAQSRAASE